MVKFSYSHQCPDMFAVDGLQFHDSFYLRVVPFERFVVILLARCHFSLSLGDLLVLLPPPGRAFFGLRPALGRLFRVLLLSPGRLFLELLLSPGRLFLELLLSLGRLFHDALYAVKPISAPIRHVKSLPPQRSIELPL